jgi:anhydro-N-acetylmuramic acid kinase
MGMKEKNTYRVIGLMSGTSLDGLDVASCNFTKTEEGWKYEMTHADTIKYPSKWLKQLSAAHTLSAEELLTLDAAYGLFLGKTVADFIRKNQLSVDFISSHGHTIFHQPRKKFTYQLGNGNAIYSVTGIPVIYDFRSLDVLKGGEGAPLVPAGDRFLFQDYDVCLNLGGIANLSMDVQKQRIAYDICFCNMGLNYLASKAGKEYDREGAMAERGEINNGMLKKLAAIYKSTAKKRPSLGRELFEQKIRPLLEDKKIPLNDRLRTFTESIAKEIVDPILATKKNATILCTGGGAFNSFLISRMLDHCGDDASLILPDENVIKFKEALVFAFLGVLRVRDEVTCLKSVTRATEDSSSGLLVGF